MTTHNPKFARLTRLALFLALLAVLTFTPLGFIPLPFVSFTIIHIPVIVAAVLFGPVDGMILGAAFGVFSMWKATVAPLAPTDLLFSPFVSGLPLQSLVMVLVPRVLLGLIAALLYLWLSRVIKKPSLAAGLAGLLASLCHSLMVLGLLSVFFDALPLAELFATVLSLNGVIEMVLAAILAAAICPPLKKALKQGT